MIEIIRPKYGVVTVATALEFDWAGYHVSEKMDGVWHELVIGDSVIVGELMADDRFFAFDIAVFDGVDIRLRPTVERLAILNRFNLLRPSMPQPGESPAEFLQRILKAGGEGIVAKVLDCPFGVKTYKVKRCETFDCVVTEKHTTKKSLRLSLDGQDVGRCGCVKEFRRVKIGDVVEIACMQRHRSGRLRDPRFIRLRPDKSF